MAPIIMLGIHKKKGGQYTRCLGGQQHAKFFVNLSECENRSDRYGAHFCVLCCNHTSLRSNRTFSLVGTIGRVELPRMC